MTAVAFTGSFAAAFTAVVFLPLAFFAAAFFAGAFFAAACFTGACFTGAFFAAACFTGACFTGACFTGACFTAVAVAAFLPARGAGTDTAAATSPRAARIPTRSTWSCSRPARRSWREAISSRMRSCSAVLRSRSAVTFSAYWDLRVGISRADMRAPPMDSVACGLYPGDL
ncbi:pentapeptide repeat-containing protein [Streptomyces sp. NBC_01278]|uniref:pentapeptide repeat-containing protein n=1 Tax=Streptomyces sp. NBC_01278 TaxID=2903809 RepID=UPI003FCE170B